VLIHPEECPCYGARIVQAEVWRSCYDCELGGSVVAVAVGAGDDTGWLGLLQPKDRVQEAAVSSRSSRAAERGVERIGGVTDGGAQKRRSDEAKKRRRVKREERKSEFAIHECCSQPGTAKDDRADEQSG